MSDIDKLEYGESKEEKTEDDIYKYFGIIFIGVFVGYIILVISMFAVPRSRYNKAKKDHPVSKKPSKTIIAFYFVNHILCLCTIVSLIILPKSFTFMFAIFTVIFWILNLVFGFVYTINPGKTEFVSALNEHVEEANSTNLMGYVYAYGYKTRTYYRKGKRRTETTFGYSTPYLFSVHGSNFTIDNFSIPDRNMFGYKFNIIDNDDTDSKKAIIYGETEINKNGKVPTILEWISGYYPDFKEVKFFSTTGKLSGIYGQAARVIAGIFGFGTYYDHTTSAIPLYSSTIHRDIAFNFLIDQEKQDFLHSKPDLDKYYKKHF